MFDYRVIEEETGWAEAGQPGVVKMLFRYGKCEYLV